MRTELRPRQLLEPFVLLVAPFAPHLAEELWEKLGHRESLACAPWPVYDPAKLVQTSVEVVIQVNGKVRSKITVDVGTPDDRLESLALADAAVQKQMAGKHLAKTIVVKNKLVNLVVK
jgi:leucyl-tRNA synthetase